MRIKRILSTIAALAAAALLAGCGARDAAQEPPETTAQETVRVVTPAPTPDPPRFSLADEGHPALMTLDGDGDFMPEQAATRAELCRALRPLVAGTEAGQAVFSDLHEGDEGYDACAALYTSGLLPYGGSGRFYPRQAVLRAELEEILARLADGLGGEDSDRVRALLKDVTEESFGEGRVVRRAELAIVAERLAGREPEAEKLLLDGLLPGDVRTSRADWAYIADAVTEGAPPTPAEGVHRTDGWLYAAWPDGTMIVDMDWGVWTFGLDGRYTTGSEELDRALYDVLAACGADRMDTDAALEAAYLYVRHNYEYLVRPEDMTVEEVGATGWEYERAERFFRYGGGTCYGFAAAFGLLARALGQEAYIVAAQVNEYHGPHGFVVIPADGIDWIYDVELENTRPERHADLALFHIRNHQVYHYWYVTDWAVPEAAEEP